MTIDDVEFFESASERRQAIERTLSSGNLPVVDRPGKELLPSTREPSKWLYVEKIAHDDLRGDSVSEMLNGHENVREE